MTVSRLPAGWYEIIRSWDCNKAICDLVHHDKTIVYESLI